MPIYAYACSACGFRQDILQKLSDAPLSECPSCHEASFSKQLTAPGFVLKGSGWYVTDFRDNGSKKNAGDAPVKATEPSAKADASGGASAAEASSTAAPTQGVTSSKASDTPASSSPAAASASSSTGGAAKAAP
ncbi:MAG: FmdB family zinc ribbon protein [Burkholderiaceae bacterium]